jgi:anti-sigma factor RsiW
MMHDIVVDELERHLSGGGTYRNASRAFYAHLDACEPCRVEVAQMDELSTLFQEFRIDPRQDAVPQPSLGFYSRVRNQIVAKPQKQAWGIFSPGAAFFRRVAFASLLLLAGLGSFLVTRESSFGGTDAAAIMAQHDPVAVHTDTSDRDRMLVTLATYQP